MMERMRETRLWLLLTVLGVCVHLSLSQVCPALAVPSFGQLLYNGNDVTRSQPTYNHNDTVEYRCAQGYELIAISSSMTLDQTIATCGTNGAWSLPDATCTLSSGLLLSERDVIIIVGAVLGAIIILLLILNICCCCWAFKLRTRIIGSSEDEVAFARSQGAFTLSNPLMVTKDDDSAGNPLYLTPDEMNEFEGTH